MKIIFQNVTTNDDPGTFGGASRHRYVIIRGGQAITANVKASSYDEVRPQYDPPGD